MEYITRTIYRTRIECVRGETIAGSPVPVFTQMEPLEILGKLTGEQATRAAVKHYKLPGIVVTRSAVFSEIRGMPIDQFIAGSVLMRDYRASMPETVNTSNS